MDENFIYSDERFADLQLLRYRLNGFECLSLRQKKYIYYLSQATLCGRDITTDQFGRYNLLIRKMLEALYLAHRELDGTEEYEALTLYLKRLWFSNGIYHHYGCEKFTPGFSQVFLHDLLEKTDKSRLPLAEGQSVATLEEDLFPVIFDKEYLPKRVNKEDGKDLIKTSACNYYENVTQEEVETFYAKQKRGAGEEPPSFGLNTKLIKRNGIISEKTYAANGLYGPAIRQIVSWLNKAGEVAENTRQQKVISLLVKYYQTGDLKLFDEYSIEWLSETDGLVDFINGFIEVYGDPLGLKGSWEGIVEYKDLEATKRTRLICDHAQWFEDNSPVDRQFKKTVVRGVTANVVCAAMLGGDEYPSTAIGINLPNADWIRARYGSKSVTISNLTEAYNKVAKGNGMLQEFIIDEETRRLVDAYGDLCDNLHTDLHECVGHGSGQLLPGTSPDALKAYGNTIEEARADLFGLYYIADDELVKMGLLPNSEAYKAHYYSYMLNGLMTQLVRIQPGHHIEEAHMRNRALIAHWVIENYSDAASLVKMEDKTCLVVHDYVLLRTAFATLLREIQRIKSEGDYTIARLLVEQYGVNIEPKLHEEVLGRYKKLNIAPYKGFINPWLKPILSADGSILDIEVDYTESYTHQMLRYSRDYSWL